MAGDSIYWKEREGHILFVGCHITILKNNKTAKITIVHLATTKVVTIGFTKINILIGSKDIEKKWNGSNHHRWKLSPIFEDLKYLKHSHGIQLHIKTTPNLIISEAKIMATTDSKYVCECF